MELNCIVPEYYKKGTKSIYEEKLRGVGTRGVVNVNI